MDEAQFTALFTQKTKARARETGHWFHGWLGNMMDTFHGVPDWTKGGNGCDAWQDWMMYDALRDPAFKGISFSMGHLYSCFNLIGNPESPSFRVAPGSYFIHKIVVAHFSNGHDKVLDPWRDPGHPVYDYHEYVRRYTLNGILPGKD